MIWIDGLLIIVCALLAAAAHSSRREATAARREAARAEGELAAEKQAREADRAVFDEERRLHLYDHRQLVSRRVMLDGAPPLDVDLVREPEPEASFDTTTEEGVEEALSALGGGRLRGSGRIADTREEYDRLLTLQEQFRARKRQGTPAPSPREPLSPYEAGERPLTHEDFAAVDDAAHAP